MQIETLEIPGPLLLHPKRFEDARGWFSETWSRRTMTDAEFAVDFVQDNLSLSLCPGVLRGLHCQIAPYAQGKLIQVVTGAVRDVAVDIREGSRTYGQHITVDLCEEEPTQLWVPPGFLHGFVTLRSDTRVLYKASEAYSREHERVVAWNDPDLAIDWGVDMPILSYRDKAALSLKDQPTLFPELPQGS